MSVMSEERKFAHSCNANVVTLGSTGSESIGRLSTYPQFHFYSLIAQFAP